MPKMGEKLSFLSLARHIKYLRSTGLYRLDQKAPKVFRYFHMMYMLAVLSFFAIYTVQQILKIYQVRDNLNKVMATMFLLLTNTDCIYKIVIFWKKPQQIEEVLNIFKGPIFNQGEAEHRSILLDTVRTALLILRIFNSMCLVTCFLWALHPTVLHMQRKQIEFSVWLPFDANNDPFYYVAVIYVWIQTSWLAYSNTTLDVFIAFLLEQCRTQVTILRLDLENVVQKSKKEAIATHRPFIDIFDFRFKKIIKHHKEIVNTADKIQDVFGEAVFYQFCVTGWILCTSAIMIVSTKPASIEFVSMIMYVACILIEVYLFCYYGNELTYESEKLTESAYCVDWLQIPVKQRRSLVIFMERVKRPIRPMAGLIIPLSNSTFISILRSSYSFYALLKNSAH